MKITIGLIATITLTLIGWIIWKPTLNWVFTRIPPETPHDWAPKLRIYKNGILQ